MNVVCKEAPPLLYQPANLQYHTPRARGVAADVHTKHVGACAGTHVLLRFFWTRWPCVFMFSRRLLLPFRPVQCWCSCRFVLLLRCRRRCCRCCLCRCYRRPRYMYVDGLGRTRPRPRKKEPLRSASTSAAKPRERPSSKLQVRSERARGVPT